MNSNLKRQKFKLSANKVCVFIFSVLIVMMIIIIAGFFKYLNTQSLDNNNDFIRTTVIYFSSLSIIAIMLFSFAVFIFTSYKHDKKMIQHQKEKQRLISQKAKLANKANMAKSKFLSDISHDIRTPINGIIGMTNIAINNIENPQKVKQCLEKIDISSSHLLCLINDILDMSRIENDKVTINNQPTDINNILMKCNAIIEGHLQNRDIQFITEFDTFKHPYFKGDELHILKILINILGNAVKFTPDGGKIYFMVTEDKKVDNIIYYRFEVKDTGIGMKEEFLNHIWDSFSQENNHSRTEYKGTGLGLAITKQLTTLLNGNITVETKENIGSRFIVELPFEISEKSIVSTAGNAINIKGFKILLVEDNELNKEIVKDILEDYGAIITTANNGKTAIEKFCNSEINYFDLILMDVLMPVMDGLTATKFIRNMQRSDAKTIPIIAMTANIYQEITKKALESGMNGYLSKPIEINNFLKTIESFKKI